MKKKNPKPSLWNSHTIYMGIGTNWTWDADHYLVVSCDPAIRNMAIRIEKRFKNPLNNTCGDIILIETDKVDLLEKDNKSRYELLYDFLDKFREIFKDVHIFIIERQLPKNFEAVKMSQHIISYFLNMRHESRIKNYVVMDVNSQNKGKQLGVPQKCKDYWLKRWSIVRAEELFKIRKDERSLEILKNNRKKDDIADVAIQIEAVFRLLKLPLTQNFDHDYVWTIEEVQRKLKPAPKEKIVKPSRQKKETKAQIMKQMRSDLKIMKKELLVEGEDISEISESKDL